MIGRGRSTARLKVGCAATSGCTSIGVRAFCACAGRDAAVPWWQLLTLSAPPAGGHRKRQVVFYAADLGDAPASD